MRECETRGLSSDGKKGELVDRLYNADHMQVQELAKIDLALVLCSLHFLHLSACACVM